MTTNDNPPEDDKYLLQQAMEGVRPLSQDKITPYKHRPRPYPHQTRKEQQQVIKDMMSDPLDPCDVETGEELLFTRTGLQRQVFRKLRRGQYRVEAELDLHGKTAREARQLIAEFLAICTTTDIRVVRIIHGKGHGSRNKQPILKNKVNHWLQQRDEVLAFCSARPIDGGTGAIYVLLRRRR